MKNLDQIKLSVILPAYNEEDGIKLIATELLPALHELNIEYEIIVVDDGSGDQTVNKVRSLAIPRLVLVEHKINRGIGAALRTGIAWANGELTVMLDSDMTFHPKYIKNLLARFASGGVDVVIGSPSLASFSQDVPFYRKFISKCSNLVYSILFGHWLTAVTPIFRLYKTADLKALKLEAEKFDITVEILFKLIQAGKKFAEIPVPLGARQFGVSKLDYRREMIRHFKLIQKIIRWRLEKIFS